MHQGGQLEIYSNYKSPSKNYSNIEAYVYLNDKYLGEAEMLPYTPPGPDGVDAGQNIYFEFSARALGEQELTVVVINGSETESVSSASYCYPKPVTDDEEFIKLLFTGLYSRSPEPYELSENLQLLQDRIYTREQIIERLRTDFEFTKARNIILAHKTLRESGRKLRMPFLKPKIRKKPPMWVRMEFLERGQMILGMPVLLP